MTFYVAIGIWIFPHSKYSWADFFICLFIIDLLRHRLQLSASFHVYVAKINRFLPNDSLCYEKFFVKLPLKWLFIWGMTFHPSGDSHLSEVFFVPLAYMSKYIGYFYIFIVLFNSLFSFEFQIINKHLHCLVLQYEFYFYTE